MPFSIRIVRSQVDSIHGFGSPTNLSHKNATFFYEKRAELAFNKREKHSRHIACHIRFVFACFLGKFRLSDPSASLFEISPRWLMGHFVLEKNTTNSGRPGGQAHTTKNVQYKFPVITMCCSTWLKNEKLR